MKGFFSRVRNQFYFRAYGAFRSFGRLVNNLTPQQSIPAELILAFQHKKGASKAFQWALHEADGRNNFFTSYHPHAWQQWLSMLRYGHFQWSVSHDSRISLIWNSIRSCGRRTWSRLFRRYLVPELDFHDWYSVPDIYYMSSYLGKIPESVIDIGGGWGRLGMAWSAVGSRVVGITDAIEQSYMLQHQYLSCVPNANFTETVGKDSIRSLDFHAMQGIVHFPIWDLAKIPDSSIEAVSAIQVLREVNREFLEFLFTHLKRILKQGGIFYVRDNDHEYRETCMHNVKISEHLADMGFEVIKFDLIQGKDIHGVPRIFKKM